MAAAARAQLEDLLEATSEQLTEAGATAEALRLQLERQAAEHTGAVGVLREQLGAAAAAAEAARRERVAATSALAEVAAGLEAGGGSEARLRGQLLELGEKVAVLTAAHEAAAAEARAAAAAAEDAATELAALREAHAELAAEKESREGTLLCRLQEMQRECGGLLAAVEDAEAHRAEVEGGLGARLAALERQLEGAELLAPAGLTEVVMGLSAASSAAERLDVRLLRLEAQAAVILRDKQVFRTGIELGLCCWEGGVVRGGGWHGGAAAALPPLLHPAATRTSTELHHCNYYSARYHCLHCSAHAH